MADTPSNRIRLPCLLLLIVLITACLLTGDAGTNIGAPTTDIVGVPRPQGKVWEIGLYEYVSKKT